MEVDFFFLLQYPILKWNLDAMFLGWIKHFYFRLCYLPLYPLRVDFAMRWLHSLWTQDHTKIKETRSTSRPVQEPIGYQVRPFEHFTLLLSQSRRLWLLQTLSVSVCVLLLRLIYWVTMVQIFMKLGVNFLNSGPIDSLKIS